MQPWRMNLINTFAIHSPIQNIMNSGEGAYTIAERSLLHQASFLLPHPTCTTYIRQPLVSETRKEYLARSQTLKKPALLCVPDVCDGLRYLNRHTFHAVTLVRLPGPVRRAQTSVGRFTLFPSCYLLNLDRSLAVRPFLDSFAADLDASSVMALALFANPTNDYGGLSA